MEVTPPIYRLPVELLAKIIVKTPRPQWPALELVDPRGLFREATLLAWGSLRVVDIERDFIYSVSKVIGDNAEDRYSAKLEVARKIDSSLKKLIERSPLITSLSGVSLLREDPSLTTMSVQYVSRFEHLESIKFVRASFRARAVNGPEYYYWCSIHVINLTEFIESTRSRATLKAICIDQCYFLDDSTLIGHFDRLRGAFDNDSSNDSRRQQLKLETLSIGDLSPPFRYDITAAVVVTFVETLDVTRMTKLSFGHSQIEPAVLTLLVNGAPRLRHIAFGFLRSCTGQSRLAANKQLLAALESRRDLVSLGFYGVWYGLKNECGCHRFESEFERTLITIGPQLENFAINCEHLAPFMMRKVCDTIRNRMPRLKSLNLHEYANAYWLNSEDIHGIADFKELEEIEISVRFYNDSNDVLSTIIDKSPRLKRFVVSEFAPGQRAVDQLCLLHDLVNLQILGSNLTQENFIAFGRASFAANLRVLSLGSIGEGAESGVIELISKARRLRVLIVNQHDAGAGYVTDRLLYCLAESCPDLVSFCARSSGGITFDGVQMLVDRCPRLQRLIVYDLVGGSLRGSLENLKFDRHRKPPWVSFQ